MLYPIYLYGNAVLRKVSENIPQDYRDLQQFISDMYETLHKSGNGIGLAAPQVGKDIRLFVIDLSIIEDDEHPEYKTFKKTFINAEITERFGNEVTMEEGCLSLPGINESVKRSNSIRIKYVDENFKEHEEVFSDYEARVIQHEYDHIEGHVFTDHLSPIRKQLVKGKLMNIVKGKVRCGYKVKKA